MTTKTAIRKFYKLHKGGGYFDFDKLEDFILEILDENEKLSFSTSSALGTLHWLELKSLQDAQKLENF